MKPKLVATVLSSLSPFYVVHNKHGCWVFFISRFLSIDFVIIIDDRSVGSVRLFPMSDDKISADSHHYFLQILHQNIFAPWYRGCKLKLGDLVGWLGCILFGHKNKPWSVSLPWKQEGARTFSLVRQQLLLHFFCGRQKCLLTVLLTGCG